MLVVEGNSHAVGAYFPRCKGGQVLVTAQRPYRARHQLFVAVGHLQLQMARASRAAVHWESEGTVSKNKITLIIILMKSRDFRKIVVHE